MGWNYGDLLDGCGEYLPPDRPALLHGDQVVSWSQLTARSNNLARGLLALGAVAGDKVAIYLRNCPEYLETLAACFKARLVPVNVNYRYRDDELHYILDNSDAVATVYAPEFHNHVESLSGRLPGMHWLETGSSYETLATGGEGAALDIERSGDDLLFIYTGGTTGWPKAVMWRQDDLFHALQSGATAPCNAGVPPVDIAEHMHNLANFKAEFRQMSACPLMHGTGLLTSLAVLSGGGAIVTLTQPGLDVEELWASVESCQVQGMVIVGDAFARPMLKALDEQPGRWDISTLERITSSGVMWSPAVKRGLLAHNSHMMLLDAFGSSEALGFGLSVTTASGVTGNAEFAVGEGCKVFTEDYREVRPGSGEKGFIARTGPIPLGYYKDETKTSKTFPTINGVRYSIPGDWCTVEEDGTLNLLGRGSACINTGGEKVFPEEVEEALKLHADVEDALVFAVEDEKWGQAVTAVIRPLDGCSIESDSLRRHVRALLADYKVPKRIHASGERFRGPNGKADYQAARACLEAI